MIQPIPDSGLFSVPAPLFGLLAGSSAGFLRPDCISYRMTKRNFASDPPRVAAFELQSGRPAARLLAWSPAMICISIAQNSRRFALADMYNAARQCDLLELRLDRFDKAPDVGDMIAAAPKPVIMSCRRVQDGGEWSRSEEERLAMLRQCIISKADYVEIELDVADQVRRYPPAKRVISYTNYQETPSDISSTYAEALTKSPDVIKLVTRVRTPEEAWPLVQLLAKPSVPTVVIGLGKPAVMLSVLAKKIGAPWTYAALERGMEVYPGQPTVTELESVYHLASISRNTPLIGVTGFADQERATVAGLNAAFVHLGLTDRCLPLEVGNPQLFKKIIDAVRLGAVIVDQSHFATAPEIARELDLEARRAGGADFMLHREKTWQAYFLLPRAAWAALTATVAGEKPPDRPLVGRHVMIVGTNPLARAMAFQAQHAGALPIVAGRDRDAAHDIAKAVDGRFVLFEALYTTMHEILVVCSEERQPAGKSHADELPIHVAHFQPNLTVMDLTCMPKRSPLLRAAGERGSRIVSPRRIITGQLMLATRLITGKEITSEPFKEVIRDLSPDEE
jgi:3-dehydroquinate dehydratase/shikimate dehydrogenase